MTIDERYQLIQMAFVNSFNGVVSFSNQGERLKPFELSKSILEDYNDEKAGQLAKLIVVNCNMIFSITVVFNEAFNLPSWPKRSRYPVNSPSDYQV